MKRRLLFLLIIALCLTGNLLAQTDINANTYAYSRSGFAPATLTNPTTLIGANSDNIASAVTDIGFTFWFAGTPYTQFSVNENGLMTLGSTQIRGDEVNNDMATSVTLPKIAPYWDDLATGTNGYVQYALSGTAPNRILMVNWYVTVPKNAAGAANSLIQVQLSETSGYITFTYGTPAIPANNNGYTIGIGKSATDFVSLTPTSATVATAAYGTSKNNNTISPGVYTRYNFFTDRTAPTISYTALTNTFDTGNRTLTATIGDAKMGIPTSGNLVPRIYFKKTTDASYVSTPGVLQSGTSTSGSWQFTIDHSLLGGVAPGQQIQYFVIAQDQANNAIGISNLYSFPTGAVATDVNTVTTFPATPNKYTISSSFAGTVTVGTGGNFASLSSAGGLFEQINAGQLTGDVTVKIISDLAETGMIGLNAWAPANNTYKITMVPEGIRTITLSSNAIKLIGVKNMTIDGINDGSNSLTLTAGYPTALINLSAGASNNTIKNLTVNNGSITFIDNSGTLTANCSNNTIENCVISGASPCINFSSFATAAAGSNNIIRNNVIKNFGQYGIQLDRGYVNFTIANNEFFQTTGSNYTMAIDIYLVSNVGTTNIYGNKIHDLNVGSSFGTTTGISFRGTGGTLNIYNNEISLEANTTHPAADKVFGMTLGGNSGTINVINNSIYIGGSGVTSGNSAGICRTGNGGTFNLKNNAIYNARSLTAVSQYYKNYGVANRYPAGFVSDNNLIFADGTGGVIGNVGADIGMAPGTDYATLAAWQTATSQDAHSLTGNPGFTSATNLAPNTANPGSNLLDAKGAPVALVTTDMLGNARNATTPDIGAYEFVGVPITYTISGKAGMPGVTLSYTDGSAQTATSDQDGNYTLTVSYGWNGVVTPSLTGYTFSPANKSFTNVLANQTQDFTATAITYTISGNTGRAGTVLNYTDGTDKTATADANGAYSFTVSYNWSGTVTPLTAGFTYTPLSKSYSNVLANQTAQDFLVAPTLITIAGTTGVEGTLLSYLDVTPKTVTVGTGGTYSFTVPYNWSGTVTPYKAGMVFSPEGRAYANLIVNQADQNYTSAVANYTISGNAGIANAVINWTDGIARTTTADATGAYSISVSPGWTGTVTPTLAGYTFTPASKAFTNVQANQTQNFTAKAATFLIVGNTGTGSVVLSYTVGGVAKTVTSTVDGDYFFTVPYNWSGTVTPSKTGYQFDPVSYEYANVIANEMDQNYTSALITYTISGNTGVAGVTLSWTDNGVSGHGASTTVSDSNGNYSIVVSYNWEGTITPSYTGYTITPANRIYPTLTKDQVAQNYITVFTTPKLETIINSVTVTNNNDGTDDSGIIDVCNSTTNNLSFTSFVDKNIVTPSTSVKVIQQISKTNVSFAPGNGVFRLSAYSPAFSQRVSLVNASLPGTLVMRFRAFFDANNNNIFDAGENAADWIVYTVNVNPTIPAAVSILASANSVSEGSAVTLTPVPTNGGATPTYEWFKNSVSVATGNSYSFIPVSGDKVYVVMTSSANCASITTATSSSIEIVVKSLTPKLETIINSVTVTNNNDGTDDSGIIDVCNSTTNNLSFTSFVDKNIVTPSTSVKVIQQISKTNVSFAPGNGVFRLSAYSPAFSQRVSLVNASLPGTLVMRFRAFFDANNNNIFDAGENAADWIVYTVNVNPLPIAAGPITGPSTFTQGTSGITYSINSIPNATSYVWTYSGTGVTINIPDPLSGNIVTLDFTANATGGTLSVNGRNGCGDGVASVLSIVAPKSGKISSDIYNAGEATQIDAYAYRNIEIKINGKVENGAIATLYDIQGRKVFNKVLEEGEENSLPTPGIKTGVYILHVNDHGKVQTFKIPVRE